MSIFGSFIWVNSDNPAWQKDRLEEKDESLMLNSAPMHQILLSLQLYKLVLLVMLNSVLKSMYLSWKIA